MKTLAQINFGKRMAQRGQKKSYEPDPKPVKQPKKGKK
jgi:hypothetical protein